MTTAGATGAVVVMNGDTELWRADGADFTLTPTGAKHTGPSGATYPVGWTIAVPGEQIALTVNTPLETQELATTGAGIAYWEGAVRVRESGQEVGRGYLEMTGYGEKIRVG